MGDKTIVEVDFWENQTYKSLQGSWSAPIYGIQKFSDATGKINFKHEKTVNDTVYLPTGWEWCDKQWVVDHSNKHGEVDAEGWGYAATVEALVEHTRLHALKADRSTGNINRRRRWIRHRRCIALDVVKVHEERVEWAEGIRAKMKEVEVASRDNFHKLNDYYSGQKDAVEKVIIGTDNTILEVIHEFSELNERLLAFKAFLLERGAIEESYAQKLDSFSKKWINEGDAKKFHPAPGAAQPSAHLLTADPNVDIFAPEGSAAAFWNTTTTALKSAASSTTQQVQQVATTTASAATMVGSAASNVVSNVTTNARRYSDFDMGSAYGPPEPTDLSHSGENSPVKGTNEVPDVIITGPDAFVSVNPMQKKKSVGTMGAAIAAANSGASTPTAPGSPSRASSTTSFPPTTPATLAASSTSTASVATNANTDAASHNTALTTSTSNSRAGRQDSGSIVDAYYYSVSLAKRTVADRLHSYAQLLTQILPKQVDTIIEMVREATAECRNEGREIRSCLMSNCKTTDQYFNTYTHTFEQSQVELRADSKILANAMYQSSATIESAAQEAASNNLSMLAGSFGDASVAGDAVAAAINRFTNLESQDLWLAIQLYFTGANSVDSVLLMYHAFSRLQLRKLRDVSASIDELLKLTLRTFSSDQFHAWEDCSSALAMLGQFRDVLVLQCNAPELTETEPTAANGAEGQEVKKSGKGKISRFINSNPVLVARNEQFAQDMHARGIGNPRAKASAPVTDQERDPEDEVMESSGRNNASVFRSHFFSRDRFDPYIAYHGRVSYCTTTRAEAHAGGQDFSEHSMWTEASVLVTYNKVMHIMHLSQDHAGQTDALKFVKENVIMSVNLRNVLVRPLNIPREGYRDAFEVLLAGSGSKKMSLLGSLSASSKDITAIMFLTHDSFQMRSWMRVISNPFLDPAKELPDASGVPGMPKDNAAGVAPSAAGTFSIRDRKDSETYSFSGGGDGEMISGTNSLRDGTRLTRTPSAAAPPPGSPATPSTAERFNAYTGSDAVNGINALRKLKRAPSSSNNSTTTSLNNAFNAAAISAAPTAAPAAAVSVEVPLTSEASAVAKEEPIAE